jgi:flagellar protein FlbD
VIILTRLGGREMAVNPDLIERAETTPDTVLTMMDGHKLIVTESLQDVVAAVRTWRAEVAAEAYALSTVPTGPHDRNGVSPHAVAAHSALDTSLARVLRMPQREE